LSPLAAKDVLVEPDTFIGNAFEGEPEQKVLWLNKALKADIAEILGHPYKGLRIRYWREGARTAWILEEVGKVKPFTTGFIVEDNVLQSVEVLIYRESHGWEIRYPFFTNQFKGRTLKDGQLDKTIDGISGATISVNAVIRLSRLVLFLHGEAVK
jgi:hypothetical protein